MNLISPVFGVRSSSNLDSVRDYRVQNQKNMYAGILLSKVPIQQINPYTWGCLQMGVEKASKSGVVYSPRVVAEAVLLLQNCCDKSLRDRVLDRTSQFVCDCSDTLILDSAIAFAAACVAGTEPTTESVDRSIAENMAIFGVSCKTPNGVAFSATDKAKIPTLGEALSYSIANGKPSYQSVRLLASILRRKSGLSGIWPVDYPRDIYRSAMGLSGEPTPPPTKGWEDVAKDLASQVGKASIDLAAKFGNAKIEQADKETKLYIEQAYGKSTGKKPASESDLDDFAATHPEEVEKAIYSAYKNQGISEDQIREMVKAAKKKDIDWPMIAAIGGGVVAVGIIAALLARGGSR